MLDNVLERADELSVTKHILHPKLTESVTVDSVVIPTFNSQFSESISADSYRDDS